MPLLSGGFTTPATPPAPRDYARATYIDPLNREWPLDEVSRGWLATEITGLGVAPVSFVVDEQARGGTAVRHIQPGPRTINVTIDVWAPSHSSFLPLWRALGEAFGLSQDITLPPGLLVIAQPDGTTREIEVRCQGGFDNEPGRWRREDTVVVSLYAPDGYWRDRTPTVIPRAYGTTVPFLSPFMTISSGNLLGITEVNNPGTVEAWPDWVITGPMTQLVATNQVTGEAFTLDTSLTDHGGLLAGEMATITTDPGRGQVITGPGGEDWTAALDWPTAVLWSLRRGLQTVEFDVSGAAAGTTITMSFKARRRTA